jgi:hypothetical protein
LPTIASGMENGPQTIEWNKSQLAAALIDKARACSGHKAGFSPCFKLAQPIEPREGYSWANPTTPELREGVMRRILFSAAVSAGVVWASSVPATATPLVTSGLINPNVEVTSVEEVGWRRQYRRYGYPVPYAYYPPAYGYYAPPPAYAYYPPVYGYYPPPAVDSDYGDYPTDNGAYDDYPPTSGY